MDIESFSGAATVATASTIIFALAMRSWRLLARTLAPAPRFADAIGRESAQRFRDELERITTAQWTYLSAAIVFVVLFIAAHTLEAGRLYAGYPDWQLYAFCGLLGVLSVVILRHLVLSYVKRNEVALLRDANVAVGHRLQHIAADFGRLYHDVETESGVIDHLIVGASGVYAVNVLAERPVANGEVVLDGSVLQFEPGGKSRSLLPVAKSIASLEREFRRLLDHRVRVRSVIAVPGWEPREQAGDEHLIVNDRNLAMLRGWKDQADYLMNEDLDALQRRLAVLTTA